MIALATVARRAQVLREGGRRVGARIQPLVGTVTPVGRSVLLLTVLAWVVAWRLGWQEMAVIATAGLLLLAVAALCMIGRTDIAVTMTAEPERVTAGEAVTGEIQVTNRGRVPMLPLQVDLPVGAGGVSFTVPPVRGGAAHSEIFVVPTERRGVVEVGPATTARGDAIGLFRRELTWSETKEVFVHPPITALEPLGAGLMRDLEGKPSDNVSMSDLAFHALREYTPGDDLRHIHWRSSARHGTLLVRQFLDTRRSHITVVIDVRSESYGHPEDFEIAVGAAGSLLHRGLLDGYDVSCVSGPHAMMRGKGRSALDVCARAELTGEALEDSASRAARLAPDTSFVLFVTGSQARFLSYQRAASYFAAEVGKAVLRVEPQALPSMRTSSDLRVLTLTQPTDLQRLLKWGL